MIKEFGSFQDNYENIDGHLTPSLNASSNFCRLPITFANSLETVQDGQNVGPDLGPNRLTY